MLGVMKHRTVASLLALALLGAAISSVCLAEPETTPPVPLYSPPLRTPIEVGGTGLAPEVTVRVIVDTLGRVSEVEVQSIQPSSSYDELFEEVVHETLSRWRYAPAMQDGAAVETPLSWMVQFPSIKAQDEQLTSFDWRVVRSDESRVDDSRRRILSLPLEQRAKFLRVQAGTIRNSLDQAKLKSANSTRFMVFTDGPTEGLAEMLASNLEVTFDTLHRIIGERLGPQPEPYRIVVFMFASDSGYQSVSKLDWSSGSYSPLGILAFHMQMPSNESLLGTMLHEATHAYLDRYLAKPGVLFPRWLDEGFAEYVGNSTIKKGQLIPGKTRKTEIYRTPWMAVRGKSLARYGVTEVKKAMRQGKAMTIAELISMDVQDFYGEQRELHYPMSWLLVHFLRHGEESWAEESFPRLMLYVAEGYPATDAFRVVYGEPTALDDAFRRYVKTF
ncbi:MAG: hypothetical protein GY716_05270 [bacterium]|nr:hypothetical protein [bacterium]